LYIPEAFFDDQGYYTCTATNTLGTCRTTARLTIDGTYSIDETRKSNKKGMRSYREYSGIGEGVSSSRRALNESSTVYYQQHTSEPRQTIESYRFYSQPSTHMTQMTEETRYYQVPSEQQQHSEINYSIHGVQPKFQPVSFLVSHNPGLDMSTQESSSTSFMTSRPTFTKVRQ
jgi:hypothetical protein